MGHRGPAPGQAKARERLSRAESREGTQSGGQRTEEAGRGGAARTRRGR